MRHGLPLSAGRVSRTTTALRFVCRLRQNSRSVSHSDSPRPRHRPYRWAMDVSSPLATDSSHREIDQFGSRIRRRGKNRSRRTWDAHLHAHGSHCPLGRRNLRIELRLRLPIDAPAQLPPTSREPEAKKFNPFVGQRTCFCLCAGYGCGHDPGSPNAPEACLRVSRRGSGSESTTPNSPRGATTTVATNSSPRISSQ